MKNTLFLAILAGAALAGCVKNEEAVKSDSSPERIKFDAPVVSVPTRATEIIGNSSTGKYFPANVNFAVYAYKTDTEISSIPSTIPTGLLYMENVTCTHQTGTSEPDEFWAPNATYYWPKTGYLSFGAYTPVMENPTEGNATKKVEWDVVNGFTFNNFKVETTANAQYDLLYSDPDYNNTVKDQLNSEGANNAVDPMYDGVQITFKHALSSIVFMAKSEGDADEITLTKIEVKNVYDTGNFDQNYVVGSAKGTAAWTPNYGISPVNYVVYESTTGLQLKTDEYYVSSGKTTLDVTDGTRHSDLIVLPQSLKGGEGYRGNDKPDATVEITYTIKYTNADNVPRTETATATFKLGTGTAASTTYTWDIGKRYIYHISIGMQKIYFNPQVVEWDSSVDGVLVVE